MSGFQALEQRDKKGNILAEGVVSKDSPLTTGDNTGIYDVIAEDLRVLKSMLDNFQQEVTREDLDKVNAIAKQVDKALSDANKAAGQVKANVAIAQSAADNAKTYRDETVASVDLAASKIKEMKTLIATLNQTATNIEALLGRKEAISTGNVGYAVTFHDTANAVKGTISVDDDGEFHVSGLIHGDITGNVDRAKRAEVADKLRLPAKINGVAFDGTKDITVDAGLMQKKSLKVTLLPGKWDSQKEYRIEDVLITPATDIIMEPEVGTSETVYNIIADAHIVCREQGNGYFIIKCLGDAPDQSVNVRFLLL
ncbi:hypothetical protein [Selenomonas ruminantium]|uniref:Uncharacterized protein n=1 Tax=Selenomonas ruminantium TaxID=971 RepID=A0A1I0YES9_SELRU|nr:hypothetical protein [Selenomonas ruminantium]SFB10858.1 hypothetical protein SAMN05216587_111105 [Selenomonas ruminantium]